MNWIKTSDQLPPLYKQVLVLNTRPDSFGEMEINLASRGEDLESPGDGWMWLDSGASFRVCHVLYWMEVTIPSEVTK